MNPSPSFTEFTSQIAPQPAARFCDVFIVDVKSVLKEIIIDESVSFLPQVVRVANDKLSSPVQALTMGAEGHPLVIAVAERDDWLAVYQALEPDS